MKTCKKCFHEKPFQEFYTQKWMTDWFFSFCKECVKAIRRTPESREKARISDNKRYSDPKRKEYKKKKLIEFRSKNPEKFKAHNMINNFFRANREMRKKACSVCWKEWRIHYHHFDYSKPFDVIPCCAMCHSWFHSWKLQVEEKFIYSVK